MFYVYLSTYIKILQAKNCLNYLKYLQNHQQQNNKWTLLILQLFSPQIFRTSQVCDTWYSLGHEKLKYLVRAEWVLQVYTLGRSEIG